MSPRREHGACETCGEIPFDEARRVLVDGRVRRSYCSQACLRTGVKLWRLGRRKALVRRSAWLLSLSLLVVTILWARHEIRQLRARHTVAAAPAPAVAPPPPPEPTPFGPHWPPTDEEWQTEFAHASWVDPLPGPARRHPSSCREIFGEAARTANARCRTAGRCGVDLGGELWGEHVYAAHDGVVDKVARSADDAPGGIYVRIAHWGGAVYTHYFRLAAVPSRLAVGAHVEAGDVIGLVGDTGPAGAGAHLHFALSVRPSSALPEVYWDPAPLMADWPLRTPERGSVAGLTAINAPPERIAGMIPLHRAPTPRPKRARSE